MPDMLQTLMHGHDVGSLHPQLPELDGFHASVREAFATWLGCRQFDMSQVEKVHLYILTVRILTTP